MSQLCICGHSKAKHYMYILNGYDQERCKACDPMVRLVKVYGVLPSNLAVEEGTYFAAMNRAADHAFEAAQEEGKP